MSRYRETRQKQQKSGLRFSLYIIAIMICFIVFFTTWNKNIETESTAEPEGYEIELIPGYIPSSGSGQLVHHAHFSLSYVEDYEQSEWVAYELTVDELNAPRVPRHEWFNPDYEISTRSAFHRDYTDSGYTRGHLAPAADMGFDTLAMRESFYMSNISPQVRPFNNGIWRELEEQTRDWARANKRLYITTGPVLTKDLKERIGENGVLVPAYFYKVLLAPDDPDSKSIAFLIPNELSERPLMDYAVTIDSVEALTRLDFFPMYDEYVAEDTVNPKGWPVDASRFKKRVREWNRQ